MQAYCLNNIHILTYQLQCDRTDSLRSHIFASHILSSYTFPDTSRLELKQEIIKKKDKKS